MIVAHIRTVTRRKDHRLGALQYRIDAQTLCRAPCTDKDVTYTDAVRGLGLCDGWTICPDCAARAALAKGQA